MPEAESTADDLRGFTVSAGSGRPLRKLLEHPTVAVEVLERDPETGHHVLPAELRDRVALMFTLQATMP